MEVWVRVRAEPYLGGTAQPVGEAYVTLVAVGPNGEPTAVPPLTLTSDDERRRFEQGRLRAQARRHDREEFEPKEGNDAVRNVR
jgi:acyl-CoA hydrolase